MSESPINILEECVNLAIALLEGGNTQVQVGFIWNCFSKIIFENLLDKYFSSFTWI